MGRSGIDGHDCFVESLFQEQVAEHLICDFLVGAAGLMIAFGVRAGGASVPDRDDIAA